MSNKLGATTSRDVLENLNDINDTLSKGKIEFNPTNVDQIPDNTLVVLDYDGSAGVIIPDNTPRLDLKNTFTQPQVGVDATADNEFATLGQVKKLGILENDVEWTVGTGGKFTDLDSAIIETNKYYSRDYTKTITLKVISNITIDNRVTIFRGGCRVIVTCENENIIIAVNKNSTRAINYTFAGFNFEFRNVNIKVEGSSTGNHNGCLFCFGNFKLINLKVTGKPCIIIHNSGGEVNDEMHKTNAVIDQLNVEFSPKLKQALVYIGNNSSLAIFGSKDTNIISNANIGFVSRSGSNIWFHGGITCNNVGTLFQVQWGGFISISAPSSNIVLNGATKTSQEVLVPTANGLILGPQ